MRIKSTLKYQDPPQKSSPFTPSKHSFDKTKGLLSACKSIAFATSKLCFDLGKSEKRPHERVENAISTSFFHLIEEFSEPVFMTGFLHFYAMRNALFHLCVRAERDESHVIYHVPPCPSSVFSYLL